jgi:hypothetical protein
MAPLVTHNDIGLKIIEMDLCHGAIGYTYQLPANFSDEYFLIRSNTFLISNYLPGKGTCCDQSYYHLSGCSIQSVGLSLGKVVIFLLLRMRMKEIHLRASLIMRMSFQPIVLMRTS